MASREKEQSFHSLLATLYMTFVGSKQWRASDAAKAADTTIATPPVPGIEDTRNYNACHVSAYNFK